MERVEELLQSPAICSYFLRLVGDEGIKLLRRFPDSGEHSDEELAEKTEINLNSVRHTLYTLYERRLAEYRRVKDSETGWLTYLWHLRVDNLNAVLGEELERVREKLAIRLKFEEENDFYICKTCGAMFTFNDAMQHEFSCTYCSIPLSHFDNEMLATALERRVHAIDETLC
ncbi:MAG: transcription factor [Methanocalculus sp. MSAO_Arc1]|uniref:transcription factor n=1 Tax=Methanocalculus TaxID=71151 RepID=UPI000FF0FB58|nr:MULTISPECIES: transcription factor [unclassified Methanocalculus]MCP1662771.1 transcription initiation factor TFIIE subunit alpha [Methanocalculus sp. AMF5]RQD81086.1 MAG: transcription factor [Methanocalculus sp. MSAO_Arc1]